MVFYKRFVRALSCRKPAPVTLRVARTIADLESAENIELYHLTEAINYRMLDRDMWQ